MSRAILARATLATVCLATTGFLHEKNRRSQTNSSKVDLAVVGAGIVGTSVALFAQKTNPTARVLLLDAESVAAGASPHSAGTLWLAQSLSNLEADSDIQPAWDEVLSSSTVDIYRDLEKQGFDCELEEIGAVLVAGSQKEARYVSSVFLDLASRGFAVRPDDRDAECFGLDMSEFSNALELATAPERLKAIEPRLFHESEGGKVVLALHLPQSVHVDPNATTLAMAAAGEQIGVRFLGDFRVNAIEREQQDGRWKLISNNGSVVEAEKVVLACGATASLVFPEARVVPVKGQIVQSTEPLEAGYFKKIIFSASAHADFDLKLAGEGDDKIPIQCTHDAHGMQQTRHLYGRQKRDGHVIMGSGRIPQADYETKGLDYKVDYQLMESVVDHCGEIIRQEDKSMNLKKGVKDNSWACYMPFSMDGRPFLGELADRKGLYLALGFGPEGMTWGPGAGKFLANEIWKQADDPDVPMPFRDIVKSALDPNRSQ